MCLCSGVWAAASGSVRASRLVAGNRTPRVFDRRLSRPLLFRRRSPHPLRRGRASHGSRFFPCRPPASLLVCLSCLTEMVMRHERHTSRAARLAAGCRVWFGVRWQRLQSRISGFYHQRVTLPVEFWVACGRPPQFRPQLPWWQPFVWQWLLITGWRQLPRRRRR